MIRTENQDNSNNISYLLRQMSVSELKNLDNMLINVGNISYCPKMSRILRCYMQNMQETYKRNSVSSKKKI